MGMTGGHKGNQGRQEIQGKRRIPNGDKLSLYTPEYILRTLADSAYFVWSYMK